MSIITAPARSQSTLAHFPGVEPAAASTRSFDLGQHGGVAFGKAGAIEGAPGGDALDLPQRPGGMTPYNRIGVFQQRSQKRDQRRVSRIAGRHTGVADQPSTAGTQHRRPAKTGSE